MSVAFFYNLRNFVFIFLVKFDPTISLIRKIELIKLRLRLSAEIFATIMIKFRMKIKLPLCFRLSYMIFYSSSC
jgi:hypothetical protein